MNTLLRNAVFDAIGGVLLEDRREKTVACRLLMRLCVSDGQLHPAEQAVLDATMTRYGLGPHERSRIGAEMAALLGGGAHATTDPQAAADAAVGLDALIGQLPPVALRELWAHLEHGAWADGEVVAAEAWFLDVVRRHLAG